LRGTFFPLLRASDKPIAIACLRLLTLPPFPPRPLRSVPRLRLRIALSTSLLALRLYRLPLDFFLPPDLFLPPDFFLPVVRAMNSPRLGFDVDNRICFATHNPGDRIHATARTQRGYADGVARAMPCAVANIITTPRALGANRAREITTVEVGEFGFFSGLRDDLPMRIMLPRFDHTVCDRNVVVRAGCASSRRTISHRKFDSDGTAAGSLVAASSSTRGKKQNGALGSYRAA
jgi:hypothetical protein